MRKLIIFALVVLGLTETLAQTTTITRILVRRDAAASRPSLTTGEPFLDTDSLFFWVGTDTGNVIVGGPYATYGLLEYAEDAEANDTYVITIPNFPLSDYLTGMSVTFKANTANTGAATLNINSLGAKAITKNGTSALEDNDIAAGQIVSLVYDGTQFQVPSKVTTAVTVRDTMGAFDFDVLPDGDATRDIGSSSNQIDTVYTEGLVVNGSISDNAYVANTARSLSFDMQGMNLIGNGQAWASETDVFFWPISVPYAISPDSMYIWAQGAGGGDDSIEVGFYSYDGQTRFLVSGLQRYEPATTPSVVAVPFATQTLLQPGLYLLAVTVVSNSGGAVNTLLYGIDSSSQPGWFFQSIHDDNGARHIGILDNVISDGRLPATLDLGSAIDLGINDYLPLIYFLDFN